MKASAIKDAVSVVALHEIDGQRVIETDCSDFDAYQSLPHAIMFEGGALVKTGWNSDVGRAYYKSGVPFAVGVSQ